jgi:cytochrome c
MAHSLKLLKYVASAMVIVFLSACGGREATEDSPASDDPISYTKKAEEAKGPNKGIGPIKTIELAALNDDLAIEGEALFNKMCTACHKMDARHVGPGLADVTNRRTPEWIMNMILNPDEMTKKDPDAYALIAEYIAPMANQSLTEEQSRAILEYFRKYDSQ